mmetsp:Transcript_891/g.1850  ORF Transcript_891/g.1850 Transcript_891/m.1850 type:complete len:320 (-) Transcript_891:113-1072(-)
MFRSLAAAAFLSSGVAGFAPIISHPNLAVSPHIHHHHHHRNAFYSVRPTATSSLQSTLAAAEDDPNPAASVKALDAIVPRSNIVQLSNAKSNARAALQILIHFSLVVLATTVIPSPPISTLAAAFASSFYFTGMHEMVHRTAFRSKVANDAFAHVFGFLCLRPARHYYFYHWQHHKFTGNPDLDSELQPGLLDFPIDTPIGYVAYLSGLPFWVDAVFTTVRHALGICPEAYLLHQRAREEVTKEARIYLALYGLIAAIGLTQPSTIGAALLRVWVIPAIVGQPFLRFYLLAEHRGRKNTPLIYENTRTMNTNWFYALSY